MKKIAALLFAVVMGCGVALADGPVKSNDSRWGFNFLIGLDGLSTSPFGGLSTMDNAYGTRPWLNSWQLELNYRLTRKSAFSVSVGIGYESDVFKMDNYYVYLATTTTDEKGNVYYLETPEMTVLENATFQNEAGQWEDWGPIDAWETRLCTRYVTIPITFSYEVNDVSFALTAIPGLNYTSRYTGMKYSYHDEDVNNMHDKLSKYIEPYKFDVRVDVAFDWFGIFLQVPTLPLFRKTDKNNIFPMKVGAMFTF